MKPPVVLISIFRETIIGGIAVHSSNLYERIVEEGLPVRKVNYAPVFVARSPLRKARLLMGVGWRLLRLRLSGARVFHFHASNRALMYYLLAPPLALSGGKVVLSLHSGYGYDKWLVENKAYHWFNRLLFRPLHRLIFMNPEESAGIRTRYPFLRDRVVTINPFIAPPAAAIPDLDALRPQPDHFRIATIGVWMQRYNVEEVIRAAVRFHRETGIRTTVTVLLSTVIIEPVYRKKLEAIIADARATIKVELLEDHDRILDVLARRDVFVRASFLDSYGLCVAESLLVGTPAIATDVCRRCDNAVLYQRGDEDELQTHLMDVWKRRNTERTSMLAEDEDSFNAYRKIYNELGSLPDDRRSGTEKNG